MYLRVLVDDIRFLKTFIINLVDGFTLQVGRGVSDYPRIRNCELC